MYAKDSKIMDYENGSLDERRLRVYYAQFNFEQKMKRRNEHEWDVDGQKTLCSAETINKSWERKNWINFFFPPR